MAFLHISRLPGPPLVFPSCPPHVTCMLLTLPPCGTSQASVTTSVSAALPAPPPHSICAADLAKLPLSVLRCSSLGSEAALGVADGELLDEWKTNGIHWKTGP